MHNRLNELITHMSLNQSSFAEKIGVTRHIINNILRGRRPLSDGMIGRIVARTGVSEKWLRTGEGEMFATPEPTEQTPYEFAKSHGCNDLAAWIFARYCAFPPEQKLVFEKIVRTLIEAQKLGESINSVAINNVFGDNNTHIN